jgi:hypothetical protein
MTTVLALAVMGLFVGATEAWAHASSQLPHARLAAQGNEVRVEWTAAADDAADIGVGLGLLREDAMWAFLGEPGAAFPTEEEVHAFSNAPQLRDYLLTNVEIRQHGEPCDASVSTTDDFLVDGASFVFRCPERVETVEVAITVLHDRDPLYATYSVDGTVQYAVHSVAEPVHQWDFTLAAQDQRAVPLALPVGIGAAVVVIAGTLWWLRPRPAPGSSPTRPAPADEAVRR